MEYAARAQILAAGYGPEAAARAVEVRRLRDGFFRGTITRSAAQQAIDAAAREPWFASLFIRPQLPACPRGERWTREMDVSVTPDLCRVAAPIALFYGERDAWVPVERSIAVWRSCLRPLRTKFEIHRIPDAGHNMVVGESANYDPNAPGQDFSTRYRDALIGFVRHWTRAR
jgi:pimeloyl-ACP methyl ester carboxylesterase